MPLRLGSASVADEAIETIVRGAVASVSGARLDAPGRVARVLPGRRGPVEWQVDRSSIAFDVDISAAYGRVLPELAVAVRDAVAEHVARMTGLEVRAVDVTVSEVARHEGADAAHGSPVGTDRGGTRRLPGMPAARCRTGAAGRHHRPV